MFHCFLKTLYYISFFNTWEIILLYFIVMSAIINIICSVLVYYHVAVKAYSWFSYLWLLSSNGVRNSQTVDQ